MQSRPSSSRTSLLALLALTALTLLARLLGAGSGLPHLAEPDNAFLLQPKLIADGGAAAHRHADYTKYPHLVSRILMALPAPKASGPALDDHLERASSESLRPRLLIAIAGVACVPTLFLLAREFLSAGWSLFAAALLATSLLHGLFSAQGRPHVLVTLFITLTLWACVRLVRRGSWSDYAVAGIFAALSVGSLHNGIAALLPLAAAHAIRSRGQGIRGQLKLALPALLVAASAIAFLPFLFESAKVAPIGVQEEQSIFRLGCHAFHLDKIHGRGFGVIGWTLWSYEPALLGLLALALPFLLMGAARLRGLAPELRASVIVVASFVLPYLIVVGLYDASYERFVIPMLPCLALIAAWGLSSLLHGIPSGSPRIAATTLLVLGVLAFPVWSSIKLVRLLSSPDTATLAARWLSANADPRAETILMTPRLDLPLVHDPSVPLPFTAEELRVGAWIYPWTYYQLGLGPQSGLAPAWRMGWLPTLDPGFAEKLRQDENKALLDLDWTLIAEGSFADSSELPGNQQRIKAALGAIANRVASFVPYEEQGNPRALWWQESSGIERPFWQRLLAASSFGPAIQVYRRR